LINFINGCHKNTIKNYETCKLKTAKQTTIYSTTKQINQVLTIWSVRRERTIYNLITVWNIVVKISTTLLVKVSIDGHVGTTGTTTVSGAVTAQSRAHAARRDVAVAF
tara:strand:- start:94 stop:417 length:324 start_codon:yes stop_codon:yes gene_type:complete